MLYTGIDGGGSKTEAVVCDESCRVLRRALTGAVQKASQSFAAGAAKKISKKY